MAERLGLKVLQPEKVRDPAFLEIFRELAPELVVVAAFGQILPPEILHEPRLGCINIHPSLLPKCRGAAPIPWTLIRGEHKTGVTIMRMDEGVDSGPILLQEETPIGPEEAFGQLHDRLSVLGAELLLMALAMLRTRTLLPRPQDPLQATFAPRLRREDGLIRWDDDARRIVSLVRGLSPLPGAYTFLRGKQLKVLAAVEGDPVPGAAPGTVAGAADAGLRVAAGSGCVVLTEVQLEGKRPLPVREFLRPCLTAALASVGWVRPVTIEEE
jgi:methionyl-tRNA formyltransferase